MYRMNLQVGSGEYDTSHGRCEWGVDTVPCMLCLRVPLRHVSVTYLLLPTTTIIRWYTLHVGCVVGEGLTDR